jgi:hypothetical protein
MNWKSIDWGSVQFCNDEILRGLKNYTTVWVYLPAIHEKLRTSPQYQEVLSKENPEKYQAKTGHYTNILQEKKPFPRPVVDYRREFSGYQLLFEQGRHRSATFLESLAETGEPVFVPVDISADPESLTAFKKDYGAAAYLEREFGIIVDPSEEHYSSLHGLYKAGEFNKAFLAMQGTFSITGC